MKNVKLKLALGVAGVAVATALSAPAQAACVVDGDTVTCDDLNTATEVNTAVATVVGDDVTLNVTVDADVTQPINFVTAPQQGAVVINNAGELGEEVAQVGVAYGGTAGLETNTFTLDNSGVITGQVITVNVGGATTITNTGSIGTPTTANPAIIAFNPDSAGSVSIDSSGTIDAAGRGQGILVSSRGDVDIALSGDVGTEGDGVTASSLNDVVVFARQQVALAPDVDVVVDGTETTTTTTNAAGSFEQQGGSVDISLTEGTSTGFIIAEGLGDVTIDVDGTVGAADDIQFVNATSNFNDLDITTVDVVDGADSSFTETTVRTAVGGFADITVGDTGTITGNASANGLAGASVTIDGTVGTSGNFVGVTSQNYNETTVNSTSVTGADFNAVDTYDYSDVGGLAELTVGADGTLNGSTNVSGFAGAAVDNAGTITDGVTATSEGYTESNVEEITTDFTTYVVQTGSYSYADTGGEAIVTNAAGGLIGDDEDNPTFVNVSGDTAAIVDNAGRMNANVTLESSAESYTEEYLLDGTLEVDGVTGVETTTVSESYSETSTNLGGDAEFSNAAGGLVVGSVTAYGDGSVTINNQGAVTGTTFAQSRATDETYSYDEDSVEVFTPGVDGGTVTDYSYSETYTEATSGGDVTGTYAGTNGAVQFVNGGSSDGSVYQDADGDSSALVTGTIFGSFTGNATGYEYTETFAEVEHSELDADGDDSLYEYSYEYAESETTTDSASSLVVNGGEITESANLYATGDATASLGNGAIIGGDLNLTSESYGGYDYVELYDEVDLYDADGVLTDGSYTYSETYDEYAGTGDVSVTIGEATVGGDVEQDGSAGTNTFTLAANGEVGGSVELDSYAETYSEVYDEVGTYSDAGPFIYSYEYSETGIAAGGDATATVAGVIGNDLDGAEDYGDVSSGGGDLEVYTNAGDALATVTGQVRDDIEVYAGGSNYTFSEMGSLTDFSTTEYSNESTSTAVGGTATLVADGADPTVPVNFGDIYVVGFSGSTVTISDTSSVLAGTDGADMQVGDFFFNTSSSYTGVYEGGSTTGYTTTYSATGAGGPSTLTNDGWIGFDGGSDYDGDDAFVQVIGTTATATNNGWIFGSVDLLSVWTNYQQTSVATDLGDVLQEVTNDRTYSSLGGTALLTNNGLITGDASMAAGDGTLVNNGVIRGDIFLGTSVDNYSTQSVDTFVQIGEEEVVGVLPDALVQSYLVQQNGLVGGAIYVSGTFGDLDPTIATSAIDATINLNSGSVTGGGVYAEYDEETGERFTDTDVNLNGSGYLGLGDLALAQLGDEFADIDPQIDAYGDLDHFYGGARVVGVDALTKTGAGVFLITGANYFPETTDNSVADYTLDVGTFTINGGEIQLALNSDGTFGIRGDVINNAGLVLGSRVVLPAPLFGTNATVTAIDGVDVYQLGDFTQTATGTLTVGVTPTLVRVFDPAFGGSVSTNPLAVQETYLYSGLFTTPENAFGQAFTDLGTGFLTVDGDMDLDGTVALVSPTGGLFVDGQTLDIASVSGAVSATADVDLNNGSNFVDFELDTRVEGGRTIVFVEADRRGYETVALNDNAEAAGEALTAAIPGVVAIIEAGSAGGVGNNGEAFILAQDFANIFVGLDTLLTPAQVAEVLNELASGEFYGSLMTLKTTAPFVDAISNRRVPLGASGFNVWLAPSGDFVRFDGDDQVGSNKLKAENYGGSLGFGLSTGAGEIGVGFGYGRIDAHARDRNLEADAQTWMIGAYGRHEFGNLAVGADLVYGWSDWDASRLLPTMSRATEAEFDSTELRGDLRVEYMIPFGSAFVAPFGQVEVRRIDFDGFEEEGAGAVNLIVEQAEETLITPTLGLKAGTAFAMGGATLRPEASVSYSFNDDGYSFREVAYAGAPGIPFILQGVEPEDFVTVQAGLFADIGANSGAYLRGSYATGGGVDVAGIKAGVVIGFGGTPEPVYVPAPAPVAPAPEYRACGNGIFVQAGDDCPLPPAPPPAPMAPPAPTPSGERG